MFSWKLKDDVLSAEFVSNDPEILSKIKAFFCAHDCGNNASVSQSKERKFEIYKTDRNDFDVTYATEKKGCKNADEVLGLAVEWLYNDLPTENFFYLHGGLISKDDLCIALLASSNTGKTTLVMSLIESGFQYRSDDIIPVFKQDLKTCSFPKPLFFRSDSPYISYAKCKIANDNYERYAYSPANIDYLPRSLSHIVILNRGQQYEKNASLSELNGPEKIKSVLYNIFSVANATEAISCTMSLLRTVKVYRLNYYTSHEAIRCLNKMDKT